MFATEPTKMSDSATSRRSFCVSPQNNPALLPPEPQCGVILTRTCASVRRLRDGAEFYLQGFALMSDYDYNAVAFRIDGDVQSQGFYNLTEAILWLRRRLQAEDGHTVYCEVRCRGQLLWRRGKRPAVSTDSTRQA